MDVDKPEVEQARESLGIFIASGICFGVSVDSI